MKSSRISGFYEKSLEERLQILKEFAELNEGEVELLKKEGALDFGKADKMIENVVGFQQLPLGIATNFKINGKDYLVPMAVEEPSVVAAASNAAKLCYGEGFKASSTEPVMIGQVQVLGVGDVKNAAEEIEKSKKDLVEIANSKDATLVKFGGGAKDLKCKEIETALGKMLIVELHVDVRDAMGANAVNTMCEAVAPELDKISGGKAKLRIISNLCTGRMAKAQAVWKKETVGEGVVEGVIAAYEFAANDVFRAATHNKGIMNGVDAVAVACGQDWRAIEAACHSYAALSGKYLPLTKFEKDAEGNLKGSIELPLAVGLVGGAVKTNPIAQMAIKILNVKSANHLAEIIAAVGLAQNFAALRALSTEGIQKGHMRLHERKFKGEK